MSSQLRFKSPVSRVDSNRQLGWCKARYCGEISQKSDVRHRRRFKTSSSAITVAKGTYCYQRRCRQGLVRLRFAEVANAEVRAIRVMKYQRAHARFRIHHEPLGELHANFLRLQ